MKRRWLLALVVILLLAACSENKTTLTFNNKTECGMASIKITNTDSGNLQEYSLDEGKELVVDIKHGVTYRYEVTYAGRPGSDMSCEAKSGTVLVPDRGQDSTFNLVSATATPSAP